MPLPRCAAAPQGLRLGTNAWLARWSSHASGQGGGSDRSGGRGVGGATSVGRFAGVYLALGCGYAGAVFARSTTNNIG